MHASSPTRWLRPRVSRSRWRGWKARCRSEKCIRPGLAFAISGICEAYKGPDGKLGYRCPGEPVSVYISKGGREEDTVGRACLCNALVATIGQPQVRNGRYVERGVVTSGDDLAGIGRFLPQGEPSYHAADVVKTLLSN